MKFSTDIFFKIYVTAHFKSTIPATFKATLTTATRTAQAPAEARLTMILDPEADLVPVTGAHTMPVGYTSPHAPFRLDEPAHPALCHQPDEHPLLLESVMLNLTPFEIFKASPAVLSLGLGGRDREIKIYLTPYAVCDKCSKANS